LAKVICEDEGGRIKCAAEIRRYTKDFKRIQG
jgi:hypothetical protein